MRSEPSRPTRCITPVARVLGAAALVVSAWAEPARPPARGGDLVTFDVVALDRERRPVAGLAREDFVVEDDGERTEIGDFSAVDGTHRAFAVVLDDADLAPHDEEQARNAVLRLLEGGFRDGDAVTLATSSGTWWSGTMPAFGEDARHILARLKGGGLSTVRMHRDHGAMASFAAVEKAARALASIPGRKALFLFTVSIEELNREAMEHLYAVCRKAGVAVHTVFIVSSEASAGTSGPSSRFDAEELAEATGGMAIRGGEAVRTAIEVASRVGASYRLAVRPPARAKPHDWRKLEVSVQRPGIAVQGPRRYNLVETGEGPSAAAAALVLGNELSELRLEVSGFVLDAPRPDAVRLLVAVEPGSGAAFGEEPLDVSVLLSQRDTGKAYQVRAKHRPGDQGAASGEFMVEPGVLQARVVAVGEKSGRIGAVTRRIEVPAPGEYRVSTPILTDALRPAANGLPPQPVLRARRSFAPRGRIYCQFQVYGARRDGGQPPQVEASLLLRQGDGSVVRESQRTPIAPSGGGLLVRLVGLPLEGLAPGPYELLVRAHDVSAGRSAEASSRFAITPLDGLTP